MSALLNFAFEENLVRVVEEAGEPWFVAADVAKALAFRNASDAVRTVPDEEKGTHKMRTLGGEQSLITINEPGLYRLIFRSNKPEAERFQHFVFHDVLPQIRRSGHYAPANDQPSQSETAFIVDADTIATAQVKLSLVREARLLWGIERARAMWVTLGLPAPPQKTMNGDTGEAMALLGLLMNAAIDRHTGATVTEIVADAMNDDADAQAQLLRYGLRAAPDDMPAGVYVANRHEQLSSLLEGHCGRFGWQYVLRRLPGARLTGTMRFGSVTSRSVFIPVELLNP